MYSVTKSADTSVEGHCVEVAIIGMGCRFPGADSVPEFWDLLCNGVDAIGEIPASRFDINTFYDPRPGTPGRIITRWGGFVEGIETFDPYFFGISPREAACTDPQHRMLLEAAWQSIEDAGLTAAQLSQARTGVFVGTCTDDYQVIERMWFGGADIYVAMGTARANAAGRISYVLGLNGPSLALDTACSSSLLAIHLAVRSLRNGDCELALAGGANAILEPSPTIAFSQGGMLSPDGRCKAFDDSANGFVRSEGAGIILLKPLRRALDDGDPIYAVIRGSAANNDGRSSLFMAPSRHGQEEALRAAYADAGVAPGRVHYVEAHGTGTPVGDPVELESLGAVMGQGRSTDAPLRVGSVKTNIGHMEGGAGVAGAIKTALILRHGVIPRNLHFKRPTSRVDWDALPIRVQQDMTQWPHEHARLAGVSSFGISGTNVHLVLGGAPNVAAEAPVAPRKQHVLPISARDARSLAELAGSWKQHLDTTKHDLRDLCHTAALRRDHFEQRLAVCGETHAEMSAALAAWMNGETRPGVASGRLAATEWRKPVFVFSGVGSQWARMGLPLYDRYAVFADSLDRSEQVIARLAGWSLLEELRRDQNSTALGRIEIFQPALVAVQIALAELWMSWGIEPGAVIGHSVGEISAAHIAGALSLEDALQVVVSRSDLMQRTSGAGAMLACELTPEEAAAMLRGKDHRVSVGVINGPRSVVLSGDIAVLDSISAELESRDVFCRRVRMPVPSHSPFMDSLLPELRQRVASIRPSAARIPIASTVTAMVHHGEAFTPEYWARNLRDTVLFGAAAGDLLDAGERLFIEIAPHPLLVKPIEDLASLRSCACLAAGSMRRGEDGETVMLESLGKLYSNGVPVDWKRRSELGARHVDIPRHPMRRERFWVDTVAPKPVRELPEYLRPGSHPMLTGHREPADQPGAHVWEFALSIAEFPFIAEHAFQGHAILPAAAYCELALAAATVVFGAGPKTFRNLHFHQSLFFDAGSRFTAQVILAPAGNRSSIRFYARPEPSSDATAWELYFDATLTSDAEPLTPDPSFDAEAARNRLPVEIARADWYEAARLFGIEYGASFQSVESARTDDRNESLGYIRLPERFGAEAHRYRFYPPLLDALFQITLAPLISDPLQHKPIVPVSIEELRIAELCAASEFRVRAKHYPDEFGRSDMDAIAPDGRRLISVRTLISKQIGDTRTEAAEDRDRWMYQVRWDKSAASEMDPAPGRWLILADASDVGARLAAELERCGQECVVARAPKGSSNGNGNGSGPNWFGHQEWRGIVYLRALDAAGNDQLTAERLASDQKAICGPLLKLIHSYSAARPTQTPRLFAITRNAQAVVDGDRPVALSQAPVIGFTRTLALEHADLAPTLIDLDEHGDLTSLVAELLGPAHAEREIALRGDERYVARFARLDLRNLPGRRRRLRISTDSEESYKVSTTEPGVLDRIALEVTRRRAPGAGEVEIRVAAAGLNFLDVLRSLNMYPGQQPGDVSFGMECAGYVLRVGAGVTRFKEGDRVIGLADPHAGCFEAHLTIREQHVFHLSGDISYAQAATIPVAFQTAWYALHHLGRLRKGESVLIHAGAGGVGLAAIQIAKHIGAKIFATAGSHEKRDYLRGIGVDHVMDSRTLDFAEQAMQITGGRGVDVVLNSIAGEAIPKSIATLAMGGRFLEIGKRDIYANSSLELFPFRKNLSYFAIDLLGLGIEKPDLLAELTTEILEHIKAGSLAPLPYTEFRASNAADAFRFMAQAKHTGKVVVTFEETEIEAELGAGGLIRPDATYLITGGLTGLGLECARWLASEGARDLLLIGRRAPNGDALEVIADIEARGTKVTTLAVDVSDAARMDALLSKMPKLAGIIHSAGLVSDSITQNLSWPQFEEVFAPKLQGGWNLHSHAAADQLDFLVLFSSIASTLGSPGQANYGAANAFLDALAQHRRSRGLPVLTVNWGPWAETGLAAQPGRGERLAAMGMPGIPPADGIEILKELLAKECAQAAVARLEWNTWSQFQPGAAAAPFLAHLQAEMQTESSGATETTLAAQLRALSREGALTILADRLSEEITRVLRISADRLDRDIGLNRLGLDSLMAVELKHRIDSQIGAALPVMRLLKGPTIAEMAEMVYEMVNVAAAPAAGVSMVPPDIESMPDEEVDRMLRQLTTGP